MCCQLSTTIGKAKHALEKKILPVFNSARRDRERSQFEVKVYDHDYTADNKSRVFIICMCVLSLVDVHEPLTVIIDINPEIAQNIRRIYLYSVL